MLNARLTTLAQELWGQVLRAGDVAVDATAGNGHDTAFLAAAVGPTGTVHAFDVQQPALDATRRLLGERLAPGAAPALHCHLQSHAELLQHVAPGSARLVVFNLGALGSWRCCCVLLLCAAACCGLVPPAVAGLLGAAAAVGWCWELPLPALLGRLSL